MEKIFKVTEDGKYIIDENGKHVATTDPSLKDSGLPLIEIPDEATIK